MNLLFPHLLIVGIVMLTPNVFSLAVRPTHLYGPSHFAQRPMHTDICHGHRRFQHIITPSRRRPTLLQQDLRDEIEKSAQRRAYESRSRGGGTGATVGGALLGGLLAGPFGALFGAQIGSALGASSELDKARQEEMKRLGLSPDMLEQATEIGMALNQAIEGLRVIRNSVETSKRLAKLLDSQEQTLYERAKSAMESGDEDGARKLLLERTSVKEKLLKVLQSIAEDNRRIATMESNVSALETRGLELEALLRRTVGASALQNSDSMGLSLQSEDPLLKKFRDLGIEQ
jgi:hypothetical protein